MRRVTTTLALALCLLGCTTAPSSEPVAAPSGPPVDVPRYGVDMGCQDQVEGWLRADVEVVTYIGGSRGMAIEVSPDDAGVWPEPSGVDPWPVPFVPVRWPMDYTGVELGRGEVAVVDSAGHLIATTGSAYRLIGTWSLLGSIGGPKFPHTWIDGFNVCPGTESAVQK